jgi:photosystem II stability/assembly factor-like uncharacterized protein
MYRLTSIISMATLWAGAIHAQSERSQRNLPAPLGTLVPRLDEVLDESLLKNARWRPVGPAIMSGRVSAIAVVEGQPHTFYVATASGGLWKTINNGTTFEPQFNHESTVSIGDVAVSQSDPNIVWVGTGESNNRNSSSWGDGIYKSTDGGRTWTNMGLKDTLHIGRIVIHPQDPNTIYVAAMGHEWGKNKERGVFKTTDGGMTWTPSLQVDENTGAQDLVMDPSDVNTLYAGMYDRIRTPWRYSGNGPGSGIYKTTDAGKSWKKLTKGLPVDHMGRIGLSIYRKNPAVVYAIVPSDAGGQHVRIDAPSVDGGVFRSDDKGESWQRTNDLAPRPFYHGQIRIDPNNDQRIWVLGGGVHLSTDGGRTFRNDLLKNVHPDHHALWIDPTDSSHGLLGTDGGAYVTYDGGTNWTRFNTFAVGQFYGIAVDMQTPYHIYGGLQDNGVWGFPSRTHDAAGITSADAYKILDGDGMQVQVDPTDPNTIYADWHNGNLGRVNLRRREYKDIRPVPEEGSQDFRYNWNSPITLSPHDPKTLYFGGNKLFRLDDHGDRWTAVSPDLTTNDVTKISALVWNPQHAAYTWDAEAYCTITTIAESPAKKGVLWVGTDDGNLQFSPDGGQSWTNVAGNVPGIPKGLYVSRLEASHFDEKVAYAAFDGHRSDDYAPHLLMTRDSGKTWISIQGNLPKSGPVYVIREDHRNPNLLFAGTEFGIFASLDRGQSWVQLKSGLPTVAVDDAVIHARDNELVIGTHGQSIWVLDIAPLEQMTSEVLASPVHLFDIKPAELFQITAIHDSIFMAQTFYSAPNPPFGVTIEYYLKRTIGQNVDITITDQSGHVAATFQGPGYAGFQQVVWDLRRTPLMPIPGSDFITPAAENYFSRMASPGEYSVTLTAGSTRIVKNAIVNR